jgi:hypothetical protein
MAGRVGQPAPTAFQQAVISVGLAIMAKYVRRTERPRRRQTVPPVLHRPLVTHHRVAFFIGDGIVTTPAVDPVEIFLRGDIGRWGIPSPRYKRKGPWRPIWKVPLIL